MKIILKQIKIYVTAVYGNHWSLDSNNIGTVGCTGASVVQKFDITVGCTDDESEKCQCIGYNLSNT